MAEQVVLVGQHAVVVHRGIAQVDANGIDAIALGDFHQALGGCIQGFFPADLFPARFAVGVFHSLDGLAQAVRVLVNISQSNGLGADMAAA